MAGSVWHTRSERPSRSEKALAAPLDDSEAHGGAGWPAAHTSHGSAVRWHICGCSRSIPQTHPAGAFSGSGTPAGSAAPATGVTRVESERDARRVEASLWISL